ncbi:hypothetical protein DKY63_15205 [Pseudomonas putida]|uniref:Uncharacterized protein n=1 Tax=Pseudomonas putida TaxID=303 RepID=A0A2Z4RJQ1_PSEPU|nr:hypothetical protein DKY63_15205 [Pseudomonas putida]
MVVNDNAGNLRPRGVLKSIASRLAPTGGLRDGFQRYAVEIPSRSSRHSGAPISNSRQISGRFS